MRTVAEVNKEIRLLIEHIGSNNKTIASIQEENTHLEFTITLLKAEREKIHAKAWEKRAKC